MRGTSVHLRSAILLAADPLPAAIQSWLDVQAKLRLTRCTEEHALPDLMAARDPWVIVADYANLSADGLARILAESDVPFVIIAEDASALTAQQEQHEHCTLITGYVSNQAIETAVEAALASRDPEKVPKHYRMQGPVRAPQVMGNFLEP